MTDIQQPEPDETTDAGTEPGIPAGTSPEAEAPAPVTEPESAEPAGTAPVAVEAEESPAAVAETADALASVSSTEAADTAEETATRGDARAEETATEARRPAAPSPASIPKPSSIPTPAALAKAVPHPTVTPAAPALITTDHSASAAFGRVDENGTVFVRTKDGEEQEVGSYPGATDEQALHLLRPQVRRAVRLGRAARAAPRRSPRCRPRTSPKGSRPWPRRSRTRPSSATSTPSPPSSTRSSPASPPSATSSSSTGPRPASRPRPSARRSSPRPRRSPASRRTGSSGRPAAPGCASCSTSGRPHQRSATRLDRETESNLWQRFSAARNGFDKARRSHFAGLDAQHADAKGAKEQLVAEAEKLATSTDWAATAGAFKRLMDEWRRAGRASRSDDDKLWARFKAAQDSFFAAKDEVVAVEEEQYRGNLAVKEALLVEAEAILPVTDLEKAKAQLRVIQDKWDAAGKVPRSDMERVEKAMRRIEQTVRDAEDRRWKSSNPEVAARARAMVDQLERAVADLQDDLAKAEASGSASKVKKAREALEARQVWLDQARAGVAEFGG